MTLPKSNALTEKAPVSNAVSLKDATYPRQRFPAVPSPRTVALFICTTLVLTMIDDETPTSMAKDDTPTATAKLETPTGSANDETPTGSV